MIPRIFPEAVSLTFEETVGFTFCKKEMQSKSCSFYLRGRPYRLGGCASLLWHRLKFTAAWSPASSLSCFLFSHDFLECFSRLCHDVREPVPALLVCHIVLWFFISFVSLLYFPFHLEEFANPPNHPAVSHLGSGTDCSFLHWFEVVCASDSF